MDAVDLAPPVEDEARGYPLVDVAGAEGRLVWVRMPPQPEHEDPRWRPARWLVGRVVEVLEGGRSVRVVVATAGGDRVLVRSVGLVRLVVSR